jgi:hypothetical protein
VISVFWSKIQVEALRGAKKGANIANFYGNIPRILTFGVIKW